MRLFRALLAAALLVATLPALAAAEPFCQPGEPPTFRLGFAQLRTVVGEPMGQPLECEHADPLSGDSVQKTTTGLAFYRASTNSPTFTDGFRHWALTRDGLVIWTGDAIDPPGTKRSVYLALGDSLAAGYGASDPRLLGYAPRTFVALRQTGAVQDFSNFGIYGETSATFVSRGQLKRAVDEIRSPDVDATLVTLQIGSNDLLNTLDSDACSLVVIIGPGRCRNVVAVALAELAHRYRDIVTELKSALAAEPAGRLLVLTSYNPSSGSANRFAPLLDEAVLGTDLKVDCNANRADPALVGLNDVITCIGAELGVQVVDMQPVFAGKAPALTNADRNDIHPNDEGYRRMAEVLLAAIANPR